MSKRKIPMSCLGPAALAQIRATGYDVDKQIRKEQAGARFKKGAPAGPLNFMSRDSKFGVSAKDQRTMDGIVFDSKLEMNAYRVLRDRGVKFDRQIEFTIQERFEHDGKIIRPIKYVADFKVYALDGTPFIIDTKGMITPDCKLKLKLMLAQGNEVHCVKTLGELTTFLAEHNCLPASVNA